MAGTNPSSSESEFWGTIDQLIGYNVAELRAKADLSQSDIATIFDRVTGRVHHRNWLSARETGQQPFTVAELLTLASIFEVSVFRLFRIPIDKEGGWVWVDGVSKPAGRIVSDYFTDVENAMSDVAPAPSGLRNDQVDVGELIEVTPSGLFERGLGLKEWAEQLRATRDEWLPSIGEGNRVWGQTAREMHEPHPGAGKRYTAWKRKRSEAKAEEEKFLLRQAKGEEDGNDQED